MTVRPNLWPAALALALFACAVPVVGNVDEPEANRIVVALDRGGVGASKETDPHHEGKQRVVVGQGDVARALALLREHELPRPKPPSLSDAVAKSGGLVPSEAAEHAQIAALLAGEIQRTLESVDGIYLARVHLALPAKDAWKPEAVRPPSASVLIEHRGPSAPLSADSVAKLVAGGVSGMRAEHVSVVFLARPAPTEARSSHLARVGPFSVGQGSVGPIQATLALLALVAAGLSLSLAMLYSRLVRLRAAVHSQNEHPRAGHS